LLDQPHAHEHAAAETASRRGLVLAAAMMAMFIAAVESSIIATAMPTIVAQLGGFDLFSWAFSAYLLTQTVTIPVYGRLADLYGRKRVFYTGTGIFLVGSLLCGFAHTMIQLVLFRAFQGLGAGAVLPVATTIVGDIYSGEERAKIQGYLSSVWGIAAIIGPSLGALLIAQAHWSWIFWLNIPIGIAAIAMIGVFLRERGQSRRHQVDYFGAALMMVGIGLLMFAMTQAGDLSASVLLAVVVAAALALLELVRRERRATEPMLPAAIWTNRVISTANWSGFGIGAVMMAGTAFLPAYIQGVLGYSPAMAGLVLTVMSLSWSCASTISGQIMVRSSFWLTGTLGGSLLLSGSIMLAVLTPALGIVWATVGAVLIGMGLGACNTTFLVAIQSTVNWQTRGIATSSNLFARMMGRSLGAALFGAILNFGVNRQMEGAADVVDRLLEPAFRDQFSPADLERLTGVIASSLHNVYLVSAILAAGTLAVILSFPRRLRPSKRVH
jgi:EmrB/QacA subfamily drug resistance transporter